MKKIITNKKSLIIAIVLILGIALPQFASAAGFFEHAGNAIMQALGKLLTRLLSWVVDMAADFFEAMLEEGFKGHQNIAKIGWDVTRDFANMLFILFMVIIAFATILRFEKYGVKELLPKIIMIALLINFSMVICYVIIDFTNIVADFFISDAKNGVAGQKLTISAILADSFKLPDLFIPMVCETWLSQRDECYNMPSNTPQTSIDNCVQEAETGLNQCYATTGESQKTEEDDFWDVMVAVIGSTAILTIAAFVLAAGGVLLVVRLITVWFLVMIAPLAFICYVLPALRRNWESWWSQFIRWCIFAPAYSFFIWLACKISLEGKLDEIARLRTSITLRSPEAINTFFSSTGNILQFLFICGLLVGGLLAANQLGIKGASTAMTIGKRWTGTAKGWAKKQAMKPVGWAKEKTMRYPKELGRLTGGATKAGFGGMIKHIPGLKSFGRRLESGGKQLLQKSAEGKEMEAYDKKLDLMSSEDLVKEADMPHLRPAFQLRAVRKALARGDLAKTENRGAVTKSINTLRTYGFAKEADDLEEQRFSVTGGKAEREKIWKKVRDKGGHKTLKAAVVKNKMEKVLDKKGNVLKDAQGKDMEEIVDNAGTRAIQTMVDTAINVSDALVMIKELPLLVQEQIKETMEKDQKSFLGSDDFKATQKARSVYAAVTGKIHEAFKDSGGKINEAEVEKFVKNMKPTNFADVDESSIPHIAKYISAPAAIQMARYLSDEDRELYAKSFSESPEMVEQLKDNNQWNSYFKKSVTPTSPPRPANVVDLKEGGTSEQRKEAASEEMRRQAQEFDNIREKEARGKAATEDVTRQSKAVEEKMRIMEEERKKAEKERPK